MWRENKGFQCRKRKLIPAIRSGSELIMSFIHWRTMLPPIITLLSRVDIYPACQIADPGHNTPKATSLVSPFTRENRLFAIVDILRYDWGSWGMSSRKKGGGVKYSRRFYNNWRWTILGRDIFFSLDFSFWYLYNMVRYEEENKFLWNWKLIFSTFVSNPEIYWIKYIIYGVKNDDLFNIRLQKYIVYSCSLRKRKGKWFL